MEEESLLQGEKRIKFHVHKLPQSPFHSQVREELQVELSRLAQALALLEQHGAAPVLPDGKVGGNAALLYPNRRCILVSKSGKQVGELLSNDQFCLVESFDRMAWKTNYSSVNSTDKPSSDTPLLWHSLIEAKSKYSWTQQPSVALHGHAFADEDSARRMGFPISDKETLFSTPEDLNELEHLFAQFPYPQHSIFIRKGHGFFLLANSVEQAINTFENLLLPHLSDPSRNNKCK